MKKRHLHLSTSCAHVLDSICASAHACRRSRSQERSADAPFPSAWHFSFSSSPKRKALSFRMAPSLTSRSSSHFSFLQSGQEALYSPGATTWESHKSLYALPWASMPDTRCPQSSARKSCQRISRDFSLYSSRALVHRLFQFPLCPHPAERQWRKPPPRLQREQHRTSMS